MTGFSIGPIERVMILGGTRLAVDVARLAKKHGGAATIVTSPRQFDDISGSEIETHVVEKLSDAPLGDMSRTLAISLGAAWIFTPDTIKSRFNDRLVNLHGMRLPQYRGGGNWTWQVLTGNRLGFCVLHRVDGGVDTGDILEFEEFLYPAACRLPIDFINFYNDKNMAFLDAIIGRLFAGPVTFTPKPQPEYLSAYWPRVSTAIQGWMDWSWPAEALERFICAFDDPYPGAQTTLNDDIVAVCHVQLDKNDLTPHPYQAGMVYRTNGKWLMVAANGASLIVEKVIRNGENIVSSVRVGDRFFTPYAALDASKKRVIFTPSGVKA